MKINYSLINKKIKNIFQKVLIKALYILFIILVIYNILYIINYSANSKKYISIFGKLYITTVKVNDSKPVIKVNDFIVVKKADQTKIKKDDIIGYDINNEIAFHRVYSVKKESGIYYFFTKADNSYYNDIEAKQIEQINGKIIVRIPIIGLLFRLFENRIITIFIMIILILKFSFNTYKFNQNKKRRIETEKNIKKYKK